MGQRAKRWTSTSAAALVLVYVSVTAISEVRSVALWPANLVWLAVCAAICGALLALVGDGAAGAIVAAAVLAVSMFAGIWSYIFWLFLGQYVSYAEILISNPFIFQVLPQGMIVLVTTAPFGLLGVAAVTVLVPERYRQ